VHEGIIFIYDVITHSCQHLQHNWTHLVKAYDTEFTALYLIIVLNELRSLLEWSNWHCGWFEIQWSHECTVPITISMYVELQV